MKVLERTEERLILSVDTSLFPESVLFKCLYWYGSSFVVDVERDPTAEGRMRVTLQADGNVPDWGSVEGKIRTDLIDFRTRQIVADETRAIRELIAAKAFSAIDPLPLDPPGSITDPVGFDVADFDEHED